jgi:release factor glutamine methyltransferase
MAEKKLTTLLEIINYSAALLNEINIKDSRLNVELMFCEILNCDRIKLYLDFDKPLQQEEKKKFKEMLKRRLNYEPLQYILGKTNFYGYNISLNNKVLIPRQETEILVGKLLEDVYSCSKEHVRMLEIGSGSGCIAIAISGELKKKHIPHHILSIDKSNDAVEISGINSKINGTSDISFVTEDFFSGNINFHEYDYIISNPPYIPLKDINILDKEVKNYEPVMALTDGLDGLIFYERIFELSIDNKVISKIFLEIGDGLKEKIENLLISYGIKDYIFYKDYCNIDRVLKIN